MLTDVIFAECVYVLQSTYGVDRRGIAVRLGALLSMTNLEGIDRQTLWRALSIFVDHRLGFAEAYLAALAERDNAAVASFDRGIDRVATIIRVEP